VTRKTWKNIFLVANFFLFLKMPLWQLFAFKKKSSLAKVAIIIHMNI
jgi:hypothetical protein